MRSTSIKSANCLPAAIRNWSKLCVRSGAQYATKRDPQPRTGAGPDADAFSANPGDASAGQAVFHKLCGQCHTIHGKGADVGPDITVNGRASYEQLLSNVFDPSLVIGAAYRLRPSSRRRAGS